jgi:hypothetical protein
MTPELTEAQIMGLPEFLRERFRGRSETERWPWINNIRYGKKQGFDYDELHQRSSARAAVYDAWSRNGRPMYIKANGLHPLYEMYLGQTSLEQWSAA